eukprot:10514269-Heterocapsa_arctica.AAC.1
MARVMRNQCVGHQDHAAMQEDLPGRTTHRRDRWCKRPPHQVSGRSHSRTGGEHNIGPTA